MSKQISKHISYFFIVQSTAVHCTTVYDTQRGTNERSKHVINVLLVFGLGQARALCRHHKQFCSLPPSSTSSSSSMPPTFSFLPSTTSQFSLLSELANIDCHIIWNRLNQFWVVVFNQMTCVLYLYLIVATCIYQCGWHVH